MKRMRWLTVAFMMWASVVMAGFFPADDENLQYTGRIDFSDKKAPVLSWPGTLIKTKFAGTSLKVKMKGDGAKDKKGKPIGPMYNVFIDGDLKNAHVFGVEQEGEHLYTVAEGLEDKTHDVLITKRGGGKTPFLGLELDDGAKLQDPGKRPKIKMEVFGDSISVGLGSDRKRGGEHSREATDNFQAYGAIVARNIGAEYHCTAKSGIGLIKSWWPTIMPQYYDRLCSSSLEGSGEAWNFSKWTADLVIINIFQNDSWTRKGTTKEEGVSAYVDFVKKIRGHYPESRIVCVLGSMDASKGKWAGFVKNAVQQLNDSGDKKVYSYIFKVQTGYTHPNSKVHAKMAQELTQFLTTLDMDITLTTPNSNSLLRK
ncbi:MAG: SGNH/GDSL hydrolase family protein [Kiritimatiellia bacterium]|nr:SGNH/GDSL hydrolase family protein [Kiritimatiellia bacterium]